MSVRYNERRVKRADAQRTIEDGGFVREQFGSARVDGDKTLVPVLALHSAAQVRLGRISQDDLTWFQARNILGDEEQCPKTKTGMWRKPTTGATVNGLHCTDTDLVVVLRDGRTVTVPLDWYPRLLNATPQQRQNWHRIGHGTGIHWPDIDEDLSVDGLLAGRPATSRSQS